VKSRTIIEIHQPFSPRGRSGTSEISCFLYTKSPIKIDKMLCFLKMLENDDVLKMMRILEDIGVQMLDSSEISKV
jgi:hypothetical protein